MVPWRRGEAQDLLSKLGAREKGERARRMSRGDEEGCRVHEGAENMSQGKNTGLQEWRYHNRGRRFWFTEKSGSREMPGDLQR